MPIRAALPDPVARRARRSRPPGARSTMRRLAVLIGALTIMIPAAPAYAGELLANGGFESGTFDGWTTTQPASPLTPWTVATAADSGYFVLASPQEGTYDALNGFDGDGPGSFALSQTVSIPAGATVLSWKDRIQYAMNLGAAARLLEVKIVDPNTDAVLATVHTFTTGLGDGTCCSIPPGHDTGWQTHTVDLTAFGGQTVKLVFDETIPENYTGPGQIELDAISVLQLLSTSPGTLAFGARDIGDASPATQVSTLTNSTGLPVTLSGLTVGGDDPTQFELLAGQAGDCASSTVLATGESCDVRVNFDPTSVGAKSAALSIASSEPDVTVTLTGRGTLTELTPSPATLDLGSRDVDDGATADQGSTVTNSGTEPVALSGLALTGDAAQFERLTGGAGDCTADTTLLAGESCDLRLRFDPDTTGAHAATLTVASSAADVTVALSGDGVQTELSSSPDTQDFGSRDVDGGGAATQTATLTNSGTESITLSALTLTGDAAQFERLTGEAGDCTATTTLLAGQSCDLRLRFDPSASGAMSATLTIASNVADRTVALTGTGVKIESPAVVAPPPAVAQPATSTPSLPAVARLWTLERRAPARVTRQSTGLRVNTGYFAVCPAGGPACSGRLTLKVLRRSAITGKVLRVFLTGKVPSTTIPAGTKRRVTFLLRRSGARLLRKRGSITVRVRGAMHAGTSRAVVRNATLRISAPR